MKIKIFMLITLAGLTACSSTSKVMQAETHQASALHKVTLADHAKDKAQLAKDKQIANLTQEVKILLAVPQTSTSQTVANQLLDSTLTLTGAPGASESELEKEVAGLLADKAQNEVAMANINAENNKIKKDLADADKAKEQANQKLSTTTTTLYQTALKVAADDDTKSTIFHIMIGVIIFIVLMVLLRIFFTMTKTGATIAAKLP